MAKRTIKVEVGDTIEVHGIKFICTGLTLSHDEPAWVTFASPEELITEPADG